MPARDRESVLRSLRDWLGTANPKADASRLDPDADIIESRILESLQVVEFVLFLERQSGREILAEELNPATLRTLNSIYSNFFQKPADDKGPAAS
jgi:acyl carrier protein